MAKLSLKNIAGRITGLNVWAFGISGTPTPLEREVGERVITFLENEGLLYISYDWEHPEDCHKSADKIRDGLVGILNTQPPFPRDKRAFGNISGIRIACAEFMRELERADLHRILDISALNDSYKTGVFHTALGGLRRTCGIQIGILAAEHGIEIDERLGSILPPEANNAGATESGSMPSIASRKGRAGVPNPGKK